MDDEPAGVDVWSIMTNVQPSLLGGITYYTGIHEQVKRYWKPRDI